MQFVSNSPVSRRFRYRSIAGALFLVGLASPAFSETVPGSSNPYLAGMPNGSTCCSGDSAPGQSPVLVTTVVVSPGSSLTFTVTGSVSFAGGTPSDPPDGGFTFSTVSSNGISGATWPVDALVGVFLDASQPDLSAAPAALDFSGTGIGTSFTTLSPALKQAFFIGDGLTGTGTGSQQTFIVPAGATRLFLGTSDGVGWFNNTGSFAVTILQGPGTTPTVTVTPTLTVTATRTLTATTTPAPSVTSTVTPTPPRTAVIVPTLSFPTLALLGLALATAALLLIRRS